MIELFPSRKKRMLILVACYIALVGMYLVANRAINPIIVIILAVIGLVFVILAQYMTAFNMNNQLVSRLYDQLDVDGFLREYEPKLLLPIKNQNIALSVRLHVSNAYCAQGRFDDAMALLSSFTVRDTKKPEEDLLSRFAIVSNLCYCAEQKNDLSAAKSYMDELLALKARLDAMQAAKPEKKRMVFNTDLNEQCFALLTTGKADIGALLTLAQNNTQKLHKVTISLWIARAYLSINNRREAEKRLRQIVSIAPQLYPGKAAAQLLASLPGNAAADPS